MTIDLILPFLVATVLMQGPDAGLIDEFDASVPRTGYVRLMMSPSQVLGPEAAAEINHVLLADEMIQWLAYIPDSYSPKRPPGVIVYVPSAGRSSVPKEWRPLMDDRNLIWIGPNKGGAGLPVQERVLKAVFAPHVIANRYTIDEERVYIAGYADGGKVANLVQSADPGTFKGGLYICGALSWDENTPSGIDLIRTNRHVFFEGCPGTREREVVRVHDEYVEAGVANASLISVQESKSWLPRASYIEEAIDYLDGNAVVTGE